MCLYHSKNKLDMKKITLLLCVLCAFVGNIFAQVPNQFNYQAVARNTLGQAIPNANIKTKFTILDGSATGVNVYSEIRTLITNQLGLFTAAIGGNDATNVTGNFATIDWSTGKKFIKVEVDPLGGNNFLALGNTEMLSVPYALYAVNGKVGPQGPPNVLNVGTVTTGATGTPASATIIGTSPAQTINLVLPTGANGKISLVKTSTEPAGANCTVGGTKIEAGIDNNSNSTLDAAEVTNISYVCNGDVNNTWKLNGNTGTSPTDFIGTTDNKDLAIKTNNTDAIKILANGNIGIGTATPGTKLNIIGSAAQPLLSINNSNASPFSYGTHSISENGVGLFAQSLNGKALAGFTNSTTQPAAEFTNNVGAGVKITNNATNKPALDVINNGTNVLSYGINSFSQGGVGVFGQSNTGRAIVGFNSNLNSPTAHFINANPNGTAIELQGGMYSPSTLGGFNLVPLGVVSYEASFGATGSTDFPASFINKGGSLVISANGHYENGITVPDYMYVDLFLDAAKTIPYTEIIAINSPNFDASGGVIAGDGLVTRLDSKFLPAAGAGNPQKKYRIEIGVDDFPTEGAVLEYGSMKGVVIFYGLR
jgi:hypothetical protein